MPKATYDRTKYQAQNANLQISFCDITSPIDAAVVSVYRRKGEWAHPGVNLLTIEDLATPMPTSTCPWRKRAKLKLGSKVKEPGRRRFQGLRGHGDLPQARRRVHAETSGPR